MQKIPEKFKNDVEDIFELLKAIHEERNNAELIKLLREKVELLINKVDKENVKNKLKLLKKKVILLERNVEVCSEDFLEESFYLLSYTKKL